MAKCRNKKLIGPYIDGQLGECDWLEEHIAECSECLAEYESVQRISHLAKKADYSPPESSYWSKFGTRVIARIAARPQPRIRRYGKFFDAIFANKMAVRLVTPLLVVLITVLAVKMYAPLEKLRLSSPGEIAVKADDTAIADALTPEIAVQTANIPGEPVVQDFSVDEPIQIADYEPNIPPVMAEAAIATGAEKSTPGSEQMLADSGDREIDTSLDFVAAYMAKNPVKTSRSERPGLSNGAWAELTAGLQLSAFNTDQIIRFQILSSSNPSLAPLSSYHEAAGRFFAPEISTSRNLFELDLTERWGYASGDDNFSEDRLSHLKLELDLIRDK